MANFTLARRVLLGWPTYTPTTPRHPDHTHTTLRPPTLLVQDPARRLTLEQVQAHPWLAAGGGSPVAQQPGQGQPQNGVAPGGHGAASGGGSAAAGSGLAPGPQAVPPGRAPDGQHGQPAAAGGLEEGSTEGSSGASEAGEAGQQAQRDRLLRAALMGLVTRGLPVLTFAAGEALMCRGQPGKAGWRGLQHLGGASQRARPCADEG